MIRAVGFPMSPLQCVLHREINLIDKLELVVRNKNGTSNIICSI